jgi:hypothetical protein
VKEDVKEVLIEEVKEKVNEEVKVEVPVIEIKKKLPVMTEEEMLKKIYLTELEAANIKDAQLLYNLRQMMNMGYFNYKLNYNLLMRN